MFESVHRIFPVVSREEAHKRGGGMPSFGFIDPFFCLPVGVGRHPVGMLRSSQDMTCQHVWLLPCQWLNEIRVDRVEVCNLPRLRLSVPAFDLNVWRCQDLFDLHAQVLQLPKADASTQ